MKYILKRENKLQKLNYNKIEKGDGYYWYELKNKEWFFKIELRLFKNNECRLYARVNVDDRINPRMEVEDLMVMTEILYEESLKLMDEKVIADY